MDKPKYFYLDSSHWEQTQGIKTMTLRNDLNRGVKILTEWSYTDGWGSTRNSLRFFNVLRKNIDMNKVYCAKLTYTTLHHYTLSLYHADGYRIILKGVSGGYHGEGTRGCHDVLKACGFNETQCNKAFEYETFKVMKRIS
ncbi:hypothetical protein SUNDANCE_186 [Brevibacillus phage Sundance]|uniref:hypothetical protein n=1 Tax=Brevibacillus phage Sundance TaxID=1691958 RepID=UPI0006BDDC0E|nr:hypothetical protein AVT09_gp186 [Brevibacillus phage Sundance]ALA48002.1 hypothetical protein SUNDANCE_186 [Brevibacillus phage Sundance]